MAGWTLCVEHQNLFRKLAKIEFTKDGGFSVIMPYHKARQGLCLKVPHDPISFADSNFEGVVPGNFISDYRASSRVKLTYHADGFVHFSGEEVAKIKSGRYLDGSPKGLGLVVAPLRTPITSGPSVSLLCWGVEDFDPLTREKKSSNHLKVVDAELLYRRCVKDSWNGYLVEVFVFSHLHTASIFPDHKERERLFLTFPGFERSLGVFTFYVIRIPNSSSFLGLLFSRVQAGYDAPSGFNLSSPTDLKWSLQAIYPFPKMDNICPPASIDYEPSAVNHRLPEKRYKRYRLRYQSTNFLTTKDGGLWIPERIVIEDSRPLT